MRNFFFRISRLYFPLKLLKMMVSVFAVLFYERPNFSGKLSNIRLETTQETCSCPPHLFHSTPMTVMFMFCYVCCLFFWLVCSIGESYFLLVKCVDNVFSYPQNIIAKCTRKFRIHKKMFNCVKEEEMNLKKLKIIFIFEGQQNDHK